MNPNEVSEIPPLVAWVAKQLVRGQPVHETLPNLPEPWCGWLQQVAGLELGEGRWKLLSSWGRAWSRDVGAVDPDSPPPPWDVVAATIPEAKATGKQRAPRRKKEIPILAPGPAWVLARLSAGRDVAPRDVAQLPPDLQGPARLALEAERGLRRVIMAGAIEGHQYREELVRVMAAADIEADSMPAEPSKRGETECGEGTELEHGEKKGGERKNVDAATALVLFADELGVQTFRTPEGEPFVSVESAPDRVETWPVKSTTFKGFLQHRFYSEMKRTAGSDTLQAAINVLHGRALHEGPVEAVSVRASEGNDRIAIDLADEDRRIVLVGPKGWDVVGSAQSPAWFHRPSGRRPLPIPVGNGSISELWQFLNVSDPGLQLLLLAWMTAAMRPRGPYPVLSLVGEQGTAKSTAGKTIKLLTDPALPSLRAEPKEPRDLVIAAKRNHVLAYDNFSYIPQWLSDGLCRLATGGGYGARALYSDDEEVLFEAQRPVIITSIGDVITAPDLLDRVVFIRLAVIPSKDRLTEQRFYAGLEDAMPRLFGSLLDVIAAGMRELPTVNIPDLPRMADFALWGEAIARGLGEPPGRFGEAYAKNQAETCQQALDNSPVAPTLLRLLESREGFCGTAQQLFDSLTQAGSESERKGKRWPKNPSSLGSSLRKIATNLRRVGWEVSTPRSSETRTITITRIGAPGFPMTADDTE